MHTLDFQLGNICKIVKCVYLSRTENAYLNGNFLYFVLIGKLWTRSMKVAYNILHKLGTKQEPMVRPGDRVRAV